jgi:hypothetical protein
VSAAPLRAAAQAPPRRLDPFRPLSRSERRRHLDAYLRVLEARNGSVDLAARTLSRREAFFRELAREPVAWRGPIDRAACERWIAGAGRPALDPRAAFLVVVAKINESERYGVELELARFERGARASDPSQLFLFLEEGYHSRILVEICRSCALEVELGPPPWSTRWLIHLVRHLPDRVRWIPVLCGEVVGCTVFELLMERCTAFSSQPAVERRIRRLLGEIWRDEALHVAFLRARLGARALRVARRMLPLVARSLTRDVPALVELGCPPEALLSRVRRGVAIPPGADWIEPPSARE